MLGWATVGGSAKKRNAHRAGKDTKADSDGRGRRETRVGGHLGRGLLAALLLHVHLLVPLLIATFIYAAREEAQRAEEVDLGFEDIPPEELPKDLPPLDETPAPSAKVAKQKTKLDRRSQDKERADRKKTETAPTKPSEKVAEESKKPAEPEIVVPPLPPMPEPPTPPPQPKAHEKMVDLDNDKDVEPPPDAKYLAQKNNRAEVETRATQTNMEREQKGGEGSQEPEGERRDDKEVGDDRAKIAQLEDLKSKLGRAAPEVTPRKEAEAPEHNQPEPLRRKSPVLTLRDASPRGHEITPETVDPSLPHDPAGMMARAKRRGAFRDEEADHRHTGGKRLKLALSGRDYEYLFGKEAKAERQLAEKERSTRVGKHQRGMARVRSALENFIPEVRPGNQTALNTRAAPFAAFIARMHRSIHQLWGFGALENWDELPSTSPLNDESLMNKLEIVLNRDGTIDKVTPVRTSKYLPFDAAAIDVVFSAGPYPEPPREIRSANGKIYVHWSFFRDGRQCATSGVDYFILNNPPKGGDLGDGGDPDNRTSPSSPDSPATLPGPRRLERNLPETPGGGMGRRFVTGEAGESQEEAPAPWRAEAPHANDTAAAELARAWFAAYVRGDVTAMTQRAAFPFRSTAGIVAKDGNGLGQMLRSLVAETPNRPTGTVTIETAAGLRKLVGKLPPGLDDGSGALFAVARTDGDTMILLLTRTNKGWKVNGLVRR